MQSRSFSTRMLALVFTLLLAQPFALMAQAQGGSAPQLPNPGTTGMNRQQQQQLGLQAMGEVYKQMPVLPDSSPETQYIQRLGKKLMAVIPADRSWPYQFHVIPAADINAFALPGGPIFVNIGTITAAENEAQLAGVMAHETGHVVARHAARNMIAAYGLEAVAALAGGQNPGLLTQLGTSIAANGLMLAHSRQDETEADEYGARYAAAAGYDPRALISFFQILQRQEGHTPKVLAYLSDHPATADRIAHLQQYIVQHHLGGTSLGSGQYQAIKSRAASYRSASAGTGAPPPPPPQP